MAAKVSTPNSKQLTSKSSALRRVLEPRVLFDAAIASTYAEVTDSAAATNAAEPPAEGLLLALADLPVQSAPVTEVVFVDSQLDGATALAQQLQAPGRAVYLLDSSAAGLDQISRLLAPHSNLSSIHIISHGDDGVLSLGSQQVTSTTLQAESGHLAAIGKTLSVTGDILLYGCDVAQTAVGQQFVRQLSTLTGADVAASNDITGVTGDWELEHQSGSVDTTVPDLVRSYQGDLALDGVYAGAEDGDAAQADQLGWALDGSGEWMVAGGNGNGELQVWRVIGNQRIEQKITRPGDSTTSFGQAVSIDGNTFVVGDKDAGTSGKVYVYRLNASTMQWALLKTLDVNAVSGWGTSRIGGWTDGNYGGNQWLAISGNHIAVGAPNEGGGTGRIAWFADTSTNGDWATSASGYFDEPGGYDNESSPRFGAAVAIANSVLVVGAPDADVNGAAAFWNFDNGGSHGAVFVYNWAAGATAAPTTSTPTSGGGFVYALHGNRDMSSIGGGSVANNSRFGAAVDIEYFSQTPGTASSFKYTIVAGAPGEGSNAGEVYIYQTSGNAINTLQAASNIWGETTGGGADSYGLAVAVSQARVVVGAPNHNLNTDAGLFYYESTTNTWTGLDTNAPENFGILIKSWNASVYGGAGDDKFGRSLAFTGGNNIAAGAPLYQTDNRGRVAFFYARTPVAVNDFFTIGEDVTVATSFNPLSNDIWGTENSSSVPVTSIISSSTKGILTWDNTARVFKYNPNGQFEYLSAGQSEKVMASYVLTVTTGGVTFKTLAQVEITVTGANDAPLVDAGLQNITKPLTNEPNQTPAGPSSPSTGSLVIPTNTFFDIDQADILTYSLLSVTPISGPAAPGGFITVGGSYNNATGANSGVINYNLAGMTANSSYTVTVRVSDGTTTKDTSFVFYVARPNQNPELVGGGVPNQAATEDALFTKNVTSHFTDPDTTAGPYPESLTYTIVSQTGPGVSWLAISSGGVLTGIATNENVGSHSVTVRATDIFGNAIDSTFTVTVANTNDAPVLVNAIPRKEAIRGETFSFTLGTGAVVWGGGSNPPADTSLPYFADIDNSTADGRSPSSGDVITYKAFDALTGEEITGATGGTGLASWLRFNSATGVFSGTPPTTQPLGTILTIRLEATDRIGGAAGPIGGTTATLFEIGVFPRDGSAPVGALPALENGGQLGFDVAINSDSGEWAVVGEPGGNGGNGTIWIYRNANFADSNLAPSWALAGGVPAAGFTTTAADARLGIAVDISADGTKIVAGAPFENNRQGAVYYLSRTGSGAAATWALSATKGVSPDAAIDDRFGSAVAINENGAFVLVGAPTDDEAGTNAGAAYMYAFGGATGSGKRLPTFDTGESGAARAGDLYGSAVAFDQNMLVVGAQRDDHSGKTDAGSVYVYSTDNTEFVKLKKDPLVNPVGTADYFGASVDVESFAGRNSVVVVVGAANDDRLATDAGAVYVFRSDTMTTDNTNGGGLTSLAQQAVITAYKGGALKSFGTSVAVDVAGDALAGDLRIAVGAEINAASPGAVYAYKYKSGTGWVGQRYLAGTSAGTVNAGNAFGSAVDIAGAWFIGGSPKAEDSALSMAGRYYSFSVLTGTPDSPIELSGQIAKVVDDEVPPVVWNPPASGTGATGTSTGMGSSSMTGSSFASVLAGLGDLSTDWKKLLKPVNSWSPTSELAMPDFAAGAQTLASKGENYSEAVLFEQRTKPAVELLVRKGEISETSPEQAVPATDGQETEEAPADAAPAPGEMLQGFSSQLDAVQASRAREAQRLLSSLSSLTS